MIRTVVTPEKNDLNILVPDDYIGKQVEIILFTIDEGFRKQEIKKKKVTFDAVKLDTRGFKFNREEANER